MIDPTVVYKWMKLKNGIGYAGIIKFTAVPLSTIQEHEIVFEPLNSENYSILVWQSAIKQGLTYALSKVDTRWRVVVSNFEGNYTCSNDAIAAITAMLGLWSAVKYEVDESFIDRMEEFVIANFHSHDIPDFDLLASM